MSGEVVEFEGCECNAETTAAIRVKVEGKRIWIPKSQVDENSEVYKKGTEGKLVITEWIATQKGLV
jgi:hypothetical protein